MHSQVAASDRLADTVTCLANQCCPSLHAALFLSISSVLMCYIWAGHRLFPWNYSDYDFQFSVVFWCSNLLDLSFSLDSSELTDQNLIWVLNWNIFKRVFYFYRFDSLILMHLVETVPSTSDFDSIAYGHVLCLKKKKRDLSPFM